MKFFILALSLVAMTASASGIYEHRHCVAQTKPTSQPCGGINSRNIDLRVYLDEDGVLSGGVVLKQAYTGCYPLFDHQFGKLMKAERSGNRVRLTAEILGDIENGVPGFDRETTHLEMEMDVDFDADTVTVNKAPGIEHIQYPTKLNCR